MFGIPSPIASDFGASNADKSSLIVRPSSVRGQKSEVIDVEAARYAADLNKKRNYTVTELLSSRIDNIFQNAKPKTKEWITVGNKKSPIKMVVNSSDHFPAIGKPVVSATKIPEWGRNMVSLSLEKIEQFGKDNKDERDFEVREKKYIEEIEYQKKTIVHREDILDQIDIELKEAIAKIDDLERELRWYRND